MSYLFRFWALVGLLAALSAGPAWSGKAKAQAASVHATVSREASNWAKSTGVKVTPEAVVELSRKVQQDPAAKEILDSADRQAASLLVRSTLYAARNSRIDKGAMPETINKIDLSKIDLSAPSLKNSIIALSIDKDKGYLLVSSEPTGARIEIDSGASEGYTLQEFVASPGEHQVAVYLKDHTCLAKVQIKKDVRTDYSCPEKKN